MVIGFGLVTQFHALAKTGQNRALEGIDKSVADPQQLESLQKELLTDVAEYYDELLRTSPRNPDIRLAAAVAQRELAHKALYRNLSRSEGIEFYRRSLTLLEELVREHFDLRPRGLITMLNLLRPIYSATAAYGHFGREEEGFSWEKTDKAETLKKAAKL